MVISVNKAIKSISRADEYVVLGGTFDPVHQGHLISARALADRMGYQNITLMPCGDAYHKGEVSLAQHRLAMLNLAIRGDSLLKVDDREVTRQGATYTVDTLKELRHKLGDNCHLVWVMGTDAAASLSGWFQWQQIFTLANVIVISRAGESELDLKHWPAVKVDDVTTFKQQTCGCYLQLALQPVSISSSEIRLAVNKSEPVDHHVPQAVIEYIEQHGLYRGLN